MVGVAAVVSAAMDMAAPGLWYHVFCLFSPPALPRMPRLLEVHWLMVYVRFSGRGGMCL